ncbi:autoinducer binding domain-containing protein [uncultured Pseudoteredinibacter sp.]|uniref:helix-turn-helix transcriptional regulator n=1 Tax=uncultured Pseudoteredinibacter sp. TaxID=1641701 RepID=UPI002638A190|nr:autoinducer binding domain-containing protein [uncultured Pseudoteredinibacter sp.]
MESQEIFSAENIEFMGVLWAANSFKECFELLATKLQEFGIRHIFYGMGVGRCDRIETTFGTLSNHPPEFLEFYSQADVFEHDEEVQWGAHKADTLIWGEEKAKEFDSPGAQKMAKFQVKYGVQHGLTIPLPNTHPAVFAAIGLSATGMDQEEFEKRVLPKQEQIELLCRVFARITEYHNIYQELAGPGRLQFPQLTDSELEVLSLISKGLELKQIADIRNTGIDNINIFSRNIRKKLKAENLPQAIYKASALRII